MKRFNISSEEELETLADQLIPYFEKHSVVCFEGEMGAGKTTLIKVICQKMGVVDSMSSPTFSIVNTYMTADANSVYHFDFYRIEQLEEAVDIGVEEYFYSGDLCLIEWPERIKALIPEEHLEISIKLVGDNDREIIVIPNGR